MDTLVLWYENFAFVFNKFDRLKYQLLTETYLTNISHYRKNSSFCEKTSNFDKIHVEKTSSNVLDFLQINGICYKLNPFLANVLILYPLKIQENQKLLVRNGLNKTCLQFWIIFSSQPQDTIKWIFLCM